MMSFISKTALLRLREIYKPGTRVELVKMDDFQAPPPGTRGTVRGVDDIGSIGGASMVGAATDGTTSRTGAKAGPDPLWSSSSR